MLIDTDKARKELEKAGFSGGQVDAQLNVVRMIDEEARPKLVTKDDIDRMGQRIDVVEERLQERITAVEERLQQQIETVEERLLRAMNGRALVVVGTILAGVWSLLELYL